MICLRNLKATDSGLVNVNESGGLYQASLTSKASTKPSDNLFSKQISTKPILSPRTQNYVNGGSNFTEIKSIEIRGARQEAARPMAVLNLDQSKQNITNSSYSHLQKLVDRTSYSNSNLRSSTSRQGESRIATDRLKFDNKIITLK